MKTCLGCRETKEFVSFSKDPAFKDGHKSKCKTCERVIKQAWYQKNRDLSIARAKQYRIDNPEWAVEVNKNANKSEFSKSWRLRNPEKAQLLARRSTIRRRFKKHGLTQELYETRLVKQGGVCAVCGKIPITSSVRPTATAFDNFVIDHDHLTGNVRGIVCTNCNVALGMIRDNPDTARKLALYLEANSLLNSGSEVHHYDSSSYGADYEQPTTQIQ